MDQATITLFESQVVFSAAAVSVIQAMKNSARLPWINQYTGTLNNAISIILAVGSAAGLTFAHSGGLSEGGQIVINYPSGAQMLEFSIKSAFSYCSQKAMYRVMYHAYAKEQIPSPPETPPQAKDIAAAPGMVFEPLDAKDFEGQLIPSKVVDS